MKNGEMDFLQQKELRTEAFERRMKSRIKGKKKFYVKKAMAKMTIKGKMEDGRRKKTIKNKEIKPKYSIDFLQIHELN